MDIVTRKTNIAELIANHPDAAEVFLAFGLNCVGCFASHFDTIEEGAKVHQMIDEEIDEMIEELNMVVNKTEPKEEAMKDGSSDDSDDDFVSSDKSDLKIEVDDSCIGCGTCVVVAPKTFKMNDEYKSVVIKNFSDSDDVIKEAESSCPVDAIKAKKKDE